ncbi:carbon-nitrogen hydrolase [Lasiosphaeris hirsuta]|uniref:Carbon-nitrogen hydrolase n=1 Tax=Lasiosphaeris hirsuta TaxID=260670 RepID=A0AA40DMU1_9PEZI|nr:carbon-nitrogen hydrolase [Lasiosphaeris hirsuta]
MPPAKIRLGTASPASQPTTPATLTQLTHLAARAAAKKIDILVLPEAYVGGYPRGVGFGSVVGSRSTEGRDEYLRYFQGAVDLGDTVGEGGAGAGGRWVRRELEGDGIEGVPVVEGEEERKRGDGTREELERVARETGVFLVVGCIERAGGSLYCAVVYVCPRLGVIGKRRKVMPVSSSAGVRVGRCADARQTGSERLIWAQGSPATLRAVSTVIRGVRINLAAAICWENYMPLLRQSLYAQNINLYLAPTADARDTWLPLMRTAAIEGRCFVVSSNMCVRGGTATPQDTGDHGGNGTSDGDEALQFSEPVASSPTPAPGPGRRSSCVTEEGFEIALPSPFLQQVRPAGVRRRQSVFDEDGNEIVLPCIVGSGGNDAVTSDFRQPGGGASKTRRAVPTNGGHHAAKTGRPAAVEFVCRGGSSIVSPFGDVLAGPQWEDDEGIIYADVDFDDCIRGRLDLDTAGSYSRNDSFKFSVEGLDLTPLPY